MIKDIAMQHHRNTGDSEREAETQKNFAAMAIDDSEDETDEYDDDDSLSSGGEEGHGSQPMTPSSSRPASHVDTRPLFLNFSSDLSLQGSGKKKSKPKRQTAYRVNGVNILNRNNLDSKTAIERLQRRRENHNHVERRRRDNINNTILELSRTVPGALEPGQKLNKGNILRLTLDYIKTLQSENQQLKTQSKQYPPSAPNSPTRSGPVYPAVQSQSVPNSPMHRSALEDTTTSAVPPLALSAQYHPRPLHHHHPVLHHHHHRRHPSPATPPCGMPVTPGASTTPVNQPAVFHIPSPPLYPSSFIAAAPPSHPQPLPYHKPPGGPDQPPLPRTPPTTKPVHPPGSLRTLLPASNKPHPTGPPGFLPTLRMSGYEKIYGNVCRY